MANKRLWLGMLAITLIFGMMIVGCGNGSTGGSINVEPVVTEFKGTDVQGNSYVLETSSSAIRSTKAGDYYKLTITYKNGDKVTSEGKIEEIDADGTFILRPSVAGSGTFTIVVSDEEISSVTGGITLVGGEIVGVPTFPNIHLRANRWGEEDKTRGEMRNSDLCINLSDFFPFNIKADVEYIVTISGETDTPLKSTGLDAWWVTDLKNVWGGSSEWLGNSNQEQAENYVEIPKGRFQEKYSLQIRQDEIDKKGLDLNNQENVSIMVMFCDVMFVTWVTESGLSGGYDSGSRIPDDIETGTIMATIRDFKVVSIEEVTD